MRSVEDVRHVGGLHQLYPVAAYTLTAAVVHDFGRTLPTPVGREHIERRLHRQGGMPGAGGEQELAVNQAAAVGTRSEYVDYPEPLEDCSESTDSIL